MNFSLNGAGPEGRAWIERDTAGLSPSYSREYALVVDRAEGSEVWDVDGKRYIDFMAGVAVLNVGHRHPHVQAAVEEQVRKFWHICLSDFFYPQAVTLAEKLQAIAPMQAPTKVYFGNSGTEAVEAAIKLAMYNTGRTQFIGFLGAFHGRTLGSLSFTASKAVQRANYLSGVKVYHIPYPNAYRPVLAGQNGEDAGHAVIDYLEHQLFHNMLSPTDVAGILVEPIQGEGGYIVPTPGFFPRLREVCDRYGILLMVDEIQSGAGRTGHWWAIEHEETEPDIVCFAKGITSGYLQLGGIQISDTIRDVILNAPADENWMHGLTYSGHAAACAVGIRNVEIMQEQKLVENAREMGKRLGAGLGKLRDEFAFVDNVRGKGLLWGVEIVKDRESRVGDMAKATAVANAAMQRGLRTRPVGAGTLAFSPSLAITADEVDTLVELLGSAMDSVG